MDINRTTRDAVVSIVALCAVVLRLWLVVTRTIVSTFLATSKDSSVPVRVSKPLDHIRDSYDLVVIGSGYGGGVAASRLARAQPKQSVCVLERGLERWPGEYPTTGFSALRALRLTGRVDLGRWKNVTVNFGKTTGLYRWIFAGSSNAFVGSGLGGTSLINSNEYLRPRPEVMTSSAWPVELQTPDALAEYFERAEVMLEPRTFPGDSISLRKYEVMKSQASSVGLESRFGAVSQTVAFEDRVNTAGVQMKRSTLSGQDSIGLNDGSKNTVLTTYIADAWCHGAEIFCGCDVRYVKKHPKSGWLVVFRSTSSVSAWPWTWSSSRPDRWVHAKELLFLGAGSLGSTEIVLRSEKHGLPISRMAGRGVSGNGGFLGFGYDLNERVDALTQRKRGDVPPGPTISAMIDCRGHVEVDQDFIVQDGAFTVMEGFFRLVKPLLPISSPTQQGVLMRARRLFHLLDPFSSTMRRTQIYLVQSHDNSNGTMDLIEDALVLDVNNIDRHSNLIRIKNLLVDMTHRFGGVFTQQLFKVVVHCLGGLGVAGDGTGKTGATSHSGELFSGPGDEVHAGLYVVDGSVVPRSLGANPFATITALAERIVDLAANSCGLKIDLASQAAFETDWRKSVEATPTQLTFSETMIGHFEHSGVCTSMTLYATINVERTPTAFEGTLFGTVECPALSPQRLVIRNGVFHPFALDTAEADQMAMLYDFVAIDSDGGQYVFRCRKVFNASSNLSIRRLWRASTTLAVNVKKAESSSHGVGTLHIDMPGVLSMIASMTVDGRNLAMRRRIVIDFLVFFVRKLLLVFMPRLVPIQYSEHNPARKVTSRVSDVDGDLEMDLLAADGAHSTLRMWEPTTEHNDRTPQDILFIPGTAVSHLVFASPFVQENAMAYFTKRGYRCWCLTTRFGMHEGNATKTANSSYSARLDIAAALAEMRQFDVASSRPYVVAHCVGSLALASALLDGTVPASSIAGITASQIFLTPCLSRLNGFKARLPLNALYRVLTRTSWFACDSPQTSSSMQRLLDTLLRFYPLSSPREICSSNVCHRCNLVFGRLWNHASLNAATHSHLHEIFGGLHTACSEHLADMGRKQAVTDDLGKSLVTEEALARLEGLPVLCLSGADNAVYTPESSLRTCNLLKARFGKHAVRRRVLDGFGHLDLWLSERAGEDGGVYGIVHEEIRRVGKA